MATYRVEFRRSVQKDLRAIPKQDQIRILRRISNLADDPRPVGCKKISGQERYRARQGNYRILDEIKDVGNSVGSALKIIVNLVVSAR